MHTQKEENFKRTVVFFFLKAKGKRCCYLSNHAFLFFFLTYYYVVSPSSSSCFWFFSPIYNSNTLRHSLHNNKIMTPCVRQIKKQTILLILHVPDPNQTNKKIKYEKTYFFDTFHIFFFTKKNKNIDGW